MLKVKFRANAMIKFLLGGGVMLWLKYLKSGGKKKDCYYFSIKKASLVTKRVATWLIHWKNGRVIITTWSLSKLV